MKTDLREYKIIDNFFDQNTFKEFQTLLFSTDIPWYYRNTYIFDYKNQKDYEDYNKVHTEGDKGYFSLCFFNNHKEDYTLANPYLYELYNRLQVKALIESRANLIMQNSKKEDKLYFHFDKPFDNHHLAILYMNTNNGGTFILPNNDETKKPIHIKSIENRLVIMDGRQLHAVDSQTDTKRRIIVNLNYF